MQCLTKKSQPRLHEWFISGWMQFSSNLFRMTSSIAPGLFPLTLQNDKNKWTCSISHVPTNSIFVAPTTTVVTNFAAKPFIQAAPIIPITQHWYTCSFWWVHESEKSLKKCHANHKLTHSLNETDCQPQGPKHHSQSQTKILSHQYGCLLVPRSSWLRQALNTICCFDLEVRQTWVGITQVGVHCR